MLYQINQSKDNVLDQQLNESSVKLNTSNNTIMTDQAVAVHQDDDTENQGDGLNIIPLNTWSTKYEAVSDSNNNCLNNIKMSEIQESNDSSFISMSPMNIHKYDNSSVDTSITRDSCIISNTMRYGQANSKPQFQKKLMINRLRRKRKFDHISNDTVHQNNNHREIDGILDNIEPPKKRTNVKDIDLMSSRDLKNEIKRIHKTKGNNGILTRKDLLLRKSVHKISNIVNNKDKDSKKRIKNVMKKVFKLRLYLFMYFCGFTKFKV